MSRRVLGPNFLCLDLIKLSIDEDAGSLEPHVDARRCPKVLSKVQANGVGVVDALYSGLSYRLRAREYQSLKQPSRS